MNKLSNYLKKRLNRFRAAFPNQGFILENPTDLAYFTGLNLSRGRFLIGPQSAVLFVDGRYTEIAKKQCPYPVKELSEEALIALLKTKAWKNTAQFGFDTALSVKAYQNLKKVLSKVNRTLKGYDGPVHAIRAIKDSQEIEKIRESAALLWKGFLYIRKALKIGIQERELALAFEIYVKKLGAEALSFSPIIAFGENSALPHHRSSERRLKKGDIVLIDIGVVLHGYASDMTRVVFFGQVSKRLEEIYHIVRKAHQAAVDGCKAGAKVASLDKIARKVMGKEEKHFLHSLGHGIGLEVHEFPRVAKESRDVLQPGMMITIEPGLYLPGLGGVRYEDMILITETGHENLFKDTTP